MQLLVSVPVRVVVVLSTATSMPRPASLLWRPGACVALEYPSSALPGSLERSSCACSALNSLLPRRRAHAPPHSFIATTIPPKEDTLRLNVCSDFFRAGLLLFFSLGVEIPCVPVLLLCCGWFGWWGVGCARRLAFFCSLSLLAGSLSYTQFSTAFHSKITC